MLVKLSGSQSYGLSCLIDNADVELLEGRKVRLNAQGYPVIRSGCIARIIAQTPDGLETDHINADPMDCRRCNLENVTKGENVRRMHDRRRQHYPGVLPSPVNNRWLLIKQPKNYRRIVGAYHSEEAAIVAGWEYDLRSNRKPGWVPWPLLQDLLRKHGLTHDDLCSMSVRTPSPLRTHARPLLCRV